MRKAGLLASRGGSVAGATAVLSRARPPANDGPRGQQARRVGQQALARSSAAQVTVARFKPQRHAAGRMACQRGQHLRHRGVRVQQLIEGVPRVVHHAGVGKRKHPAVGAPAVGRAMQVLGVGVAQTADLLGGQPFGPGENSVDGALLKRRTGRV